MKVWIARNKSIFDGTVSIYMKKPIYQDGVFVGINSSYITEIFVKDFKKLFGFAPRKGSCEQCELNLIRKK